MARFAALLGSINVGGNRLKMDELRAALEAAGFQRVETVIASGNVLFDCDGKDAMSLAPRIEAVLEESFGIRSFAAVRSKAEVAAAIADNPFVKDGEPKFVHTLFLERPVSEAAVEAFAAGFDGPERIAAGDRSLFIDYSTGVARSQIDPALKKAKLIEGRATARNVRSLARILERMED